jgi:hypothetical protein
MYEDPRIIQMNIDRYRAMLDIDFNSENRARIEQLLREAISRLALASHVETPQRG